MGIQIFLVALVLKPKECGIQTYARLFMTTKAEKLNQSQTFIKIPKYLGFHDSKTVFVNVEFHQEVGN